MDATAYLTSVTHANRTAQAAAAAERARLASERRDLAQEAQGHRRVAQFEQTTESARGRVRSHLLTGLRNRGHGTPSSAR